MILLKNFKMNFLKILSAQEKMVIESQLSEQFGIESIPGLIVKMGEERLFLFSGDLSEDEIKKLAASVPIERLGIYFAKIMSGEDAIKPSIEGSQVLSAQIKKNVFELKNEQEVEDWMKGQDLQIKTEKKGFLVIKYKEDFLGCGKASAEKIGNFIPKSRRLKQRG